MARRYLLGWLVVGLAWGGFSPVLLAQSQQATGEACYVYPDNESLVGARYVAMALAKRRAIEAFPAFQEGTANVQDPVLLREMTTNLLVRGMEGVKVVQESEDPAKRKICRTVQATMDAGKVKVMLHAVARAYRFRKGEQDSGLPGNGQIQVVSAQESYCVEGGRSRCLYLAVQCVRNTFGERSVVRVTWYDADGKPSFTAKERVLCEHKGDVATFWLRMPPQGAIFSLDVPVR